MFLVKCDQCGRDIFHRENYIELSQPNLIATLSTDIFDKHLCSWKCLVAYSEKVHNAQGD